MVAKVLRVLSEVVGLGVGSAAAVGGGWLGVGEGDGCCCRCSFDSAADIQSSFLDAWDEEKDRVVMA